jgi:hypothetical protein
MVRVRSRLRLEPETGQASVLTTSPSPRAKSITKPIPPSSKIQASRLGSKRRGFVNRVRPHYGFTTELAATGTVALPYGGGAWRRGELHLTRRNGFRHPPLFPLRGGDGDDRKQAACATRAGASDGTASRLGSMYVTQSGRQADGGRLSDCDERSQRDTTPA